YDPATPQPAGRVAGAAPPGCSDRAAAVGTSFSGQCYSCGGRRSAATIRSNRVTGPSAGTNSSRPTKTITGTTTAATTVTSSQPGNAASPVATAAAPPADPAAAVTALTSTLRGPAAGRPAGHRLRQPPAQRHTPGQHPDPVPELRPPRPRLPPPP